jgi:hypothetical protein
MPQVAADQFQIVVDGRSSNLEIRIFRSLPAAGQTGEPPAGPCSLQVFHVLQNIRRDQVDVASWQKILPV